jgi:hypothetical protein
LRIPKTAKLRLRFLFGSDYIIGRGERNEGTSLDMLNVFRDRRLSERGAVATWSQLGSLRPRSLLTEFPESCRGQTGSLPLAVLTGFADQAGALSLWYIFSASSRQKLDEAMFALVTGGFDFKNDVFITFIADETWHPED